MEEERISHNNMIQKSFSTDDSVKICSKMLQQVHILLTLLLHEKILNYERQPSFELSVWTRIHSNKKFTALQELAKPAKNTSTQRRLKIKITLNDNKYNEISLSMLQHCLQVDGFGQSKDRLQIGEIFNLYLFKKNIFKEKLLNLSER